VHEIERLGSAVELRVGKGGRKRGRARAGERVKARTHSSKSAFVKALRPVKGKESRVEEE